MMQVFTDPTVTFLIGLALGVCAGFAMGFFAMAVFVSLDPDAS